MTVGTGFLSSGPTSARLVTGRDFSPAVSSQHGTATSARLGKFAPPGSATRPVLRVAGRDRLSAVPAKTYDHTPQSLAALARVVALVAQESEQLPALRRLRSAC